MSQKQKRTQKKNNVKRMDRKPLELTLERVITAHPKTVYNAWLNRKIEGTPWAMADQLILDPKVNGFFYWLIHGTPHYGRFIKVSEPRLIQHTWMSPYTDGKESTVTLSFKKKGSTTLMKLSHSGLPNNENGKGHEKGWSYFLDRFQKHFR